MAQSGINSTFKFESYKVDKLQLTAKPDLSLLGYTGNIPAQEWTLDLSIRNPLYFKSEKAYVGGMDMSLSLIVDGPESKSDSQNGVELDQLLKLEAGIAGIFKIDGDRFEEKLEQVLVKVQIPALLLPYLRGTITSLLANAGFGTVILPLINIHALAENLTKDMKIQVVE
ncbi:protein-export chaperone SecB [Geobacter sulfurreducens]|uniref:protein-export chaperone SecB n=1 Tax=Geobacter sulfurreducens TaxID=35554 RepID=UPI001BDC297E|nr:protein-export chaperone SecB [Geobacter sulfurreducens]QVW35925.1 protein-export chaperone SecB [Geobacter sulfurreducens]